MVNLDSGLKANIISTRLVQKLYLNQHHPSPHTLQSFGGEQVNPARIYHITFEITDTIGCTWAITQAFTAGDRPKSLPGLLLGNAGMGWANILSNHVTGKWYFGKDYIMDPLKTAKVLIQENTLTYVGYITTVHEPKEQGPAVKAPEIWKPIDKRKTTTLLSFLQEYSDVFSEEGAKH